MKPILIRSVIALGILTLLSGACREAEPVATEIPIEYEVSNAIWGENTDGNLSFEFVAKNIGTATWEDAIGGVTLFDKEGKLIGNCASMDMSLSTILPEEYTSFFVECNEGQGFDNYSLDVSAIVREPGWEDPYACADGTIDARDLVIIETKRELLDREFMNFYGVAVNANKLEATASTGYLAIFDKEGNLLKIDICSPNFQNLGWKEQQSFECLLYPAIPDNAELVWMIDVLYECELPETQTP